MNIVEEKNPVMVSIYCVVYNHEAYLRQCLDGFVMQKTNFRFEAIVHDDVSQDGSVEIIKEYAERYPNIIKPIYEHENQWSKGSLNIDMIMQPALIGKYVAFCDGDDFWTDPNKLQAQFDAMEKNPDCSICFNRVQVVESDGITKRNQIPWEKSYVSQGFVTMKTVEEEEFLGHHWCFHTCSFFIKREIYSKYIDMRKNVLSSFPYGDMSIIMCALTRGNGYFIDKVMGCYRYMSGGWNSTARSVKDKAKSVEMIKKIAEGYNQFDRYTNFKYHRGITHRNNRAIFFGIYKGMNLHPRYWEFYPELISLIIKKVKSKWNQNQLL